MGDARCPMRVRIRQERERGQARSEPDEANRVAGICVRLQTRSVSITACTELRLKRRLARPKAGARQGRALQAGRVVRLADKWDTYKQHVAV